MRVPDVFQNETTSERRGQESDLTQLAPTRVFDSHFNAFALPVGIGEYCVTSQENEMLVAVLGSCISACIRDPSTGLGGMNHFMLPHNAPNDLAQNSFVLRYGHYAMEKLINDLVSRGASKKRLEIKLFGGSSLLHVRTRIGEDNIAFVRNYLQAEGFQIASEDLGGLYPRRVHYFPKTGKVYRLLMRRSDDAQVFNDELSFRDRLRKQPVEGEVKLF